MVHQLQLVQHVRVLGETGVAAGVQFVNHQAAVFVQAEADFNLLPDVAQVYKLLTVALLQIQVEFAGIAFAEVVLGQHLHLPH
jgi:hypothetical protein